MNATLDHIHVFAHDPARSIAFYVDALGAEHLGALPSSTDKPDNHLLLLGGQFLVISAFPADMQAQECPEVGDGALRAGFGVAHFGLNVPDLDEAVARIRAHGIEPHSGPRGSGSIRFVYFSAPDGVVIELTEYVLPPRLARLASIATLFDRGVHAVRRVLGRKLVGGAKD
jgi:catechol 2,3-dioxygenase-like lactoylglutathione lyase family enzyme